MTTLTVALGIGLLMASGAQAAIVVGKSVGKVKLGYSEVKVRSIYGKPASAASFHGETAWSYNKLLLGISFKRGKVFGFTTYSKRQKTAKGIGPGSSYPATVAAYPEAVCQEGTWGPEARACVVWTSFRGRKVETDFDFYEQSLPMREIDIEEH